MLEITRIPHPAPTPLESIIAKRANPGFGTTHTDHMVMISYTEGQGWHDARVMARGPLALDPAAAVLHYAQEIFEGLKAYRAEDGRVLLFRPEANAARFNASAARMAMPELPPELFLQAVEEYVRADHEWIPHTEGGSLYIRPFMFANETLLGVRPAKEFLFIVIGCAAGTYFKGGEKAISLWVSEEYSRAAAGGTGAAKCGGNYAASLAPQAQAIAKGHDQVVFLDAQEHKYIEELGGMNIFFAFADGTLQTPPLGGTILPGITRDALLTLAQDAGLAVLEQPYSIDQWQADAQNGHLLEAFACGTAAVVSPIGHVASNTRQFSIGAGGAGQIAQKLKAQLTSIQRGAAPDTHGWVKTVLGG
jgi:branched-chain amino acid aminotransferase